MHIIFGLMSCSDWPGYTPLRHRSLINMMKLNTINVQSGFSLSAKCMCTSNQFMDFLLLKFLFVEVFWLGLTDEGHEGTFTWLSDQAAMTGPAEWCASMPDNWRGDENCGHFNWCPGRINDISCGNNYGLLCQCTGTLTFCTYLHPHMQVTYLNRVRTVLSGRN